MSKLRKIDEIKESKDHLSDQINANRDRFEHELKELKTSINKCNSNTNPCHLLHSHAKMLQTDISASATRDMLEKIATSRYKLVQLITRTIVW